MKKNKLYFNNLSTQSGSRDIFDLFSTFGKVKNLEIFNDPILMRSKGQGIIEMENLQAANQCVDKLNGATFMGKIISVVWAPQAFARV